MLRDRAAADDDGRPRPRAIPPALHRGSVSRPFRARCSPLAAPVAHRIMNILGLNAYHGDVSAALVRDGQLVAAVEEERFRRIKHCAGFPQHAIAGLPARWAASTPADVDVFAVSRDPRAHLGARRCSCSGTGRAAPSATARATWPASRALPGDDRRRRSASTTRGVRPRTRFVEHHPAHLASAAFVSAVRRRGGLRHRRVRRFRQHVVGPRRRIAAVASTATCSFRTRSGCSTSPSRSTSAFPTTATSSR